MVTSSFLLSLGEEVATVSGLFSVDFAYIGNIGLRVGVLRLEIIQGNRKPNPFKYNNWIPLVTTCVGGPIKSLSSRKGSV